MKQATAQQLEAQAHAVAAAEAAKKQQQQQQQMLAVDQQVCTCCCWLLFGQTLLRSAEIIRWTMCPSSGFSI